MRKRKPLAAPVAFLGRRRRPGCYAVVACMDNPYHRHPGPAKKEKGCLRIGQDLPIDEAYREARRLTKGQAVFVKNECTGAGRWRRISVPGD